MDNYQSTIENIKKLDIKSNYDNNLDNNNSLSDLNYLSSSKLIYVGDVIVRYLPAAGAYHYGIVYDINQSFKSKTDSLGNKNDILNMSDITIIDYNYDSKIHIYPLSDFMRLQKTFWIKKYSDIPIEFWRSNDEVKQLAYSKYLQFMQNRFDQCFQYDLIDNNCEHFVKYCKFNDPKLWKSDQVSKLKENNEEFNRQLLRGFVSSLCNEQTLSKIENKINVPDSMKFTIKKNKILFCN